MSQDFDSPFVPEPSCDFAYPEEIIPESDTSNERLAEFVLVLTMDLLENKNPRLKIAVMAYAVGIDLSYLFKCENTISQISRVLGVSKQCFQQELKKCLKEYNLKMERVQGHLPNSSSYRYTNFIKHKV
jgi:hypothetical protein